MARKPARTPARASNGRRPNDDIGEEMRLKLYHSQFRLRQAEQRAYDLFLAEPREGHEPSLARAGSDRGRLRLRDAEGRPHLLHLSGPRAHAGARRAGRESARRADAARQRPDARQGRLDAPHLRGARRDGLLRDHRRASADRLRRGAARPVQGRQGRHGLLLRRRHHQYRRVPRGAEFRRDLEAAGRVRVREQLLHGIHADRRHHGGRASGRRSRLRLRAREDRDRRQRRRRGLPHRAGGLREGARRRRPLADRVPDLSPQRPLARRPGRLSAEGRARALEEGQGPDQHLSRAHEAVRHLRPTRSRRSRPR